ncbi:PREDICTED: receptor-like protein kinase At3g21340 [Tarenaya hassleriana]|uniref:receptor-like protein kinase At3g21340 n=1 Tax=Tarenaya hassleriana TaxID=28532 RepID=UPI0008FD560B|nr:PREDICTED: receptor-like protein kinase At3g21340 [Tarenaya hassleriana]
MLLYREELGGSELQVCRRQESSSHCSLLLEYGRTFRFLNNSASMNTKKKIFDVGVSSGVELSNSMSCPMGGVALIASNVVCLWPWLMSMDSCRKWRAVTCFLALISTFSSISLAQAQNQQGFISLDCGLPTAESPYTELSTGLTFVSDSDFVHSGKSGSIQKDLEENYIKPYVVLRYFPEGIRNCYNLSVIKNVNYLIKGVFVYGNYDGLDDPPRFDLYIGPNKWGTVDLEGKINGTVEEIIHMPTSYSLEICLVKTGTTLPFITALELRPFKSDTYIIEAGSLKHLFRVYLTSSGRYIRYPDDVVDRNWSPFFLPEWTQITTALTINISSNYEPPEAAVATAATPTNAGALLTINWTLDNPFDQVYTYIHFAEIQAMQTNVTREFSIVINGNVTYTAYSPKKLFLDTIFSTAPEKCDGGKCSVQLVKTLSSTLPPLLNAIEVFTAIQLPQPETDQNDVIAIKNIEATYRLSRISWQGDPCSPQQFLWDGLNCSYTNMSTPPRIISLNLSSSGLNGIIASGIQNLTGLQELDLSDNNLTGGLPEFLGTMKSLLVIDLSRNDLSGSIPPALLERSKNGLKLNVQGNPKLCPSGSCKVPGGNGESEGNIENGGHEKNKILVPIFASVASVIVITVMLVLVFIFRKRKPSKGPRLSIEKQKRRYTYSEVVSMTRNFQRVLGKGGFGTVYHGHVNEAEQVAVKVLSHSSPLGDKQFKAEVELLLRVHHVNLVSLVGYCDEGDHVALIYEYMPNGDLRQHHSGKHGGSVLNWASRVRIVAEAASGLEYLHNGCKPRMVHRDVKSSNILLTEDFHGKLADFGLSRSFPTVSTVIAGTPGYLDPE